MALAAVLYQEGEEGAHGGDLQRVDHLSSLPARAYQTSCLKLLQVKAQRRRRDLELGREPTSRQPKGAGHHEAAEYGQASLLGERGERGHGITVKHISIIPEISK